MSYNGWTNWETWNSYNWLTSYEHTYKHVAKVVNQGFMGGEGLEEHIKEIIDSINLDNIDVDKVDVNELITAFKEGGE